MKRRRTIVTVIATLAIAAGLVLPGTAAARSYQLPTYNSGAYVNVTNGSDLSVDVVSWGD